MTHPLLDLLELNLRSLTHFELANKINTFADALAIHPGHQDPFPSTVPDSKELKELAASYNAIATAASTGDRNKVAERDAQRPKTEVNFAITTQWVVMRSVRENDPTLIANLGLEQKKRSATRNAIPPLVGAPSTVTVKHGPVSGMVIIRVSKVDGGRLYEVEACQGDPTVETSWTSVAKSAYCRFIAVNGLEPGRIYHFRVRSFGVTGNGPWSSIVSIMVI